MGLKKAIVVLLAVLFVVSGTAFADDAGFGFGLGLGIGVQSFQQPDGELKTYQSLSLTPDVAFGKFGLGLDVRINYTFTGGDDSDEFEIRREDWDPAAAGLNFLELYLPKIRYARWAHKGDPLFVMFGSIDDAVLGNGFILGNYANTQFLPQRRIFGLSLDVDGALFNFPYVGVETFVANLAAFELFGTRLFVRPLIGMDIPIVRNLQIGTTLVMDTDPYYHTRLIDEDAVPSDAGDASVLVYGLDFRQPILSNPVITLAAFGDMVFQNQAQGGMLGAGGRLIGTITYGAQLRFLGDNFIPVYFDSTYDLRRPDKYAVYNAEDTLIEGHVGWFATAGFSVLNDIIVFSVNMSGPFGEKEGVLPTLGSQFIIAEGLIRGVSLSAHYTKFEIESAGDILSAENAVIGARFNYRTGPAVVSLVYDVKYDPTDDAKPWKITSGLETSIQLF